MKPDETGEFELEGHLFRARSYFPFCLPSSFSSSHRKLPDLERMSLRSTCSRCCRCTKNLPTTRGRPQLTSSPSTSSPSRPTRSSSILLREFNSSASNSSANPSARDRKFHASSSSHAQIESSFEAKSSSKSSRQAAAASLTPPPPPPPSPSIRSRSGATASTETKDIRKSTRSTPEQRQSTTRTRTTRSQIDNENKSTSSPLARKTSAPTLLGTAILDQVRHDDLEHHDYELSLTQQGNSTGIPEDELLDALYPAWERLDNSNDVDLETNTTRSLMGIDDIAYDDIEGNDIASAHNGDPLDWRDLLAELGGASSKQGNRNLIAENTNLPGLEVQAKELENAATKTPSKKGIPLLTTEPQASPHSISSLVTQSALQAKSSALSIKPIPALAPLGPNRDLIPTSFPMGILPYLPPANVSLDQPHSRPLLSRYDWRLSSPLSPHTDGSYPPPLDVPSTNLHQGMNKLVGVGSTPYFAGRYRKEVESWGWKSKVAAGEKGTWVAADRYRQKLDRLLDLTEEAEEKSYLESLARLGTPEQREVMGRTVCRAQGIWLTHANRAEDISRMSKEDKDILRKKASGTGAVSAWWSRDGIDLTEENGYKFLPGTIVRFTPLKPGPPSTGPIGPVTDAPKYPQGTVLEVKDGQLIVVVEEADVWPLREDEYRIDIGLDDASYHLQRSAIDNLYFDPARQRQYNAKAIEAAQIAHVHSKVTSTIREWALQGTDIRELIVPKISNTPVMDASEDGLHDDSPAAELRHLPETILPTLEPSLASNPSHLLSDNQLINSWIKRHQRPNPISIEGDPVLRLNASQTRAVAMAMSESMSLIQGPPGTGKSATLVTLIHLLKSHFRIPQPILLCAPTHVSIDHLTSLLIDAGLNPLRSGKSMRVKEDLRPWTIERRREEHPLWERCEQARESSERLREELTALREEIEPGNKSDSSKEQELEDLHKREWRKFVALEQRLYSSLLATADVFCSTTIGAGATKIMNMVDFPIVFVDEAAMCTEPVSLIPLMKGAQHVCLIGDQKQLPAVVKSRDAVRERLHVSLFERLMSEQSVQSVLLDTQYRMRPMISAFPNQAFYQSALQDAASVTKRSAPPRSSYLVSEPPSSSNKRPAQPCVFVSHTGQETSFRQSTLNETEVDIVISIVGDLLSRNPRMDPSSIGIISPYASQTRLLGDTFVSGVYPGSRVLSQWGSDIAERAALVEVNTVDGYQGREKSVIILSTVRSNKSNFIGFLADRRRLNVALTRAKDLLFVVGNEKTLSLAHSGGNAGGEEASVESDAGIWRRFLDHYKKHGLIRPWNGPNSRSDRLKS